MEGNDLLNKFNFLNSRFKYKNRSLAIIKSNILYKYRELVKEEGSDLKTGPSCCKWCLNILSPDSCSVKLCPQKHPKRRVRALLNKDFSTLNKFQQKLVAKLKSRVPTNVLVFECHICKKSTLVPMRKKLTEAVNEDDDEVQFEEEVKKKKKRKRKDVFAGLNAAVVQNYKQPAAPAKPTKRIAKKSAKKLSLQQQLRMHQALTQVPTVQKRKPSLLATFLDSM